MRNIVIFVTQSVLLIFFLFLAPIISDFFNPIKDKIPEKQSDLKNLLSGELLAKTPVLPENYSEDYIIGPQDVIEIKVWDNEDLSGKVVVTLDGYINHHLIGKIKASGLSTGKMAKKITDLLANGYLVNPQVTVQVVLYKSQKVFLMGEIAKPDTYYLQKKKTTLVEIIARAGGLTKDADREVILVRTKDSNEKKSNLPDKNTKNKLQIIVDFQNALEGDLSQNIFVQSGDSIFVPKAKTYFILGEVKNSGKYKLEKGTTILKAISIAGGETEKAAIDRTKIIRTINKKKTEIDVELHDSVQPGDIIVVPESWF